MTDSGGVHEAPVAGVEEHEDALVVRLAGELDLYNSHLVRDELLAAAALAPARLIVDLAAVTFIDSTGLGVLIEARSRLENRRAFMLVSPNVDTRRALEISGLVRHFGVHASLDEALSASV